MQSKFTVGTPHADVEAGETLRRALQRDRLLVIDEAYVDFASGECALGLLRRFLNVIILRTLSKSFSLAGMRLGLCFAHVPL